MTTLRLRMNVQANVVLRFQTGDQWDKSVIVGRIWAIVDENFLFSEYCLLIVEKVYHEGVVPSHHVKSIFPHF